MTQVFISYSRSDMEFVRRLAADLQRAGLDVWWDLSDIQGSDVWERKIEEGLGSSQYFIVILTPASLESRWVRREYLSADKKELKIIPLRLKPSNEVPLTLRDIQPIDAVDRPYADVLFEVLRIVKGDMKTGLEKEEKIYSERNISDRQAVSRSFTPHDVLGRGSSILTIVYFLLAGFYVFGGRGDTLLVALLALAAILTGFFFLFERRMVLAFPLKVSVSLFLLAHSVVTYSDLNGYGVSDVASIIEGVIAWIVVGLLVANFRTARKSATYSAIVFAVFLFLVGLKLIFDMLEYYPPSIYTPTVISGIVTALLVWLEL